MKKIGFIGAGNMGFPLLQSAVKLCGKENVIFRCASEKSNQKICKSTEVEFAKTLDELVEISEIVVLAVKPQFFSDILPVIKENTFEGQLVISLAPGITIDYLKKQTGGKAKVVRTMPNTPAQVREGMTAICYGEGLFTEEEKNMVSGLFCAVGKTVELPERLMDASIVASGSSPAFMYIFMEALADASVKYGIPRTQAYEMVAQTMIGAGKMLLETGEHPGKLKDNVCSPGGTTIAGVTALEEAGLRNAIMKACDACYEKAMSMKK